MCDSNKNDNSIIELRAKYSTYTKKGVAITADKSSSDLLKNPLHATSKVV